MRTYEQHFTAGGSATFAGVGTFFRLLKTTDPVTVTFLANRREVARAENMEAGYAERMDEAFDSVIIQTATEQTIKWAIRAGGELRYDRLSGEVEILGTPSVRVVGDEGEQANRAMCNLVKNRHGTVLGAQSLEIVSVAENTSGLLVRAASYNAIRAYDGNGYIPNAIIVAAPNDPNLTIPNQTADGEIVLAQRQFAAFSAGAPRVLIAGHMQRDIMVPAGYGIWFLPDMEVEAWVSVLAQQVPAP